ncbi:tetratricopeptide repeat protein [candidate division WOR-3 bacterium]|nr:tetratricopeptide repeat protein [candidate division WOR-3 bacterium]
MPKDTRKCPNCGFRNPEGFSFCGKCGSALVGVDEKKTKTAIDSAPTRLKEKMKAESRKIKGERRRVVVMFADISGYTELSRQRDPEELKDLVDGALLKLSDMVYKYEGYIDKIMGDCLMVLFGAPIAHEDDSERAVLTAFDLLEVIKDYWDEKSARLNLSIGIARGLCYAGEYGRPGDYTVIGDDVNLAERIEKIAPPGKVYVSKDVYELTHNRINYVKVGTKVLRGLGEREVYEALSQRYLEKERRPFVGRSRELGRLQALYEKAKEGQGCYSFITGERGIGKSRTYERFKADHLDQDHIFFGQTRGIEYLRGEFYYVLRGALRSFIGLEEGLSGKESEERLIAFYKDRSELDYSLPFVKYLLSLPLEEKERLAIEGIKPEEREKNIEGIISSFLLKLADEKPVVIVVEDAQRLDTGSQNFFISLQRLLKGKRVLIIMLCWEVLQGFYKKSVNIKMKPLSKIDTRDLIKLHFENKPISSRLLATVIKMTKGHPLYIEEIIEILKQENLVKAGRSVDLIAEKIQVPDKVYNIVLARIDSADKRAKDTLKTASVAGFEFSDSLVSRIMGEEGLTAEIGVLEGKDFIRYLFDANYSFGQARIYAFKNEIVRDVAYELMLKEERRNLHKATAQVIEKMFVENLDDYSDVIAYHYLEAGDERAAPYLLRSADRKFSGFKLDDALRDYQRYLEFKKDPEIYFKLGEIYRFKADYKNAYLSYDKAEEISPSDEFRGKVKTARGYALGYSGSYDDALTQLLAAQKLLSEDKTEVARNYHALGKLYRQKGEHENSLEAFNKALKITLEEFGENHIMVAAAYDGIGLYYSDTGNYDSALEYHIKGREVYASLFGEKHPSVAASDISIGMTYGRKGDVDSALPHFEKALGIYLSMFGTEQPEVATCYNNIGLVHIHRQEFAKALRYLKKALSIEIAVFGETHHDIARSYLNIGSTLTSIGNYQQALENLKQAEQIFLSIFGEKHHAVAVTFNSLARVNIFLGDLDKGLEYHSRSRKIWTSLFGESHPHIASNYSATGLVYLELGNYKKALELFMKSFEIRKKVFGANHPATIEVGSDIAILKFRLGEYSESRDWFEKILNAEGSSPNDSFFAGLILTDIHGRMGEKEEAASCCKKVIESIATLNVPKLAASTVRRLVRLLLSSGKVNLAQRLLDEFESCNFETGRKDKTADILVARSILEQAKGNSREAAEFADQAAEIFQGLGFKPSLIDALVAKARALKDKKSIDKALAIACEIGDKSREEEVQSFSV